MREKNFGAKSLPEGKKDDSVRCDKGKLKNRFSATTCIFETSDVRSPQASQASENDIDPNDNGAVHNVAKIIKAVMSSAAEAELAGLFKLLWKSSDTSNRLHDTNR
jgi:hypothetical protein